MTPERPFLWWRRRPLALPPVAPPPRAIARAPWWRLLLLRLSPAPDLTVWCMLCGCLIEGSPVPARMRNRCESYDVCFGRFDVGAGAHCHHLRMVWS